MQRSMVVSSVLLGMHQQLAGFGDPAARQAKGSSGHKRVTAAPKAEGKRGSEEGDSDHLNDGDSSASSHAGACTQ